MLNSVAEVWNFYTILCLIIHISRIRCKTVHFHIDEELPMNVRIGSLLDYVPGKFKNLKFVQLPSSGFGTDHFAVSPTSGDIIVVKKIDRERLCSTEDKITSTLPMEKNKAVISDRYNFTLKHCQLRIQVNCLSIQSIGADSGKLVVMFDVIIQLRDKNDNGCLFLPSNEQIIKVPEDFQPGTMNIPLNFPYDPDDATMGHSIQLSSIKYSPVSLKFSKHTSSFVLNQTEFEQLFNLHVLVDQELTTFSDRSHPNELYTIPFRLHLELLRSLDFETKPNISFGLSANDGSTDERHQCHLDVLILIEDCDDHLPLFDLELYTLNVTENTPVGSVLVRVHATDVDTGVHGTISYHFIKPTPIILHFFKLNKTSGEVYVRNRLRYSSDGYYQFHVGAISGIKFNPISIDYQTIPSHTKVQVHVIDVNDQAPRINVFSPTGLRQLEIVEESIAGQDVAVIDVSDEDMGRNSEVSCALTNQSYPHLLKLVLMDEIQDERMGQGVKKRFKLSVDKTVDRELVSIIDFTIKCRDNGVTSLSTLHHGKLKVVDVNDNPPEFESTDYSIAVTEDSDPNRLLNNYVVMAMKAYDKDVGLNGALSYQLDKNTPRDILELFHVNSTSGVIRTSGKLDREKVTDLVLTLIAVDAGQSPKSARARLTIHVQDYNDNSPVFEQNFYRFTMSENSHVGDLIGVITVADEDIGLNSEVRISLEMNMGAGLFSNHPSREERMTDLVTHQIKRRPNVRLDRNIYEIFLYVNSVWDREQFSESNTHQPSLNPSGLIKHVGGNYTSNSEILWSLRLRAEDRGEPKLMNKVTIQIHIKDENDNPPEFLNPDPANANITRVMVSYREPEGFSFTQIHAVDKDAGENGTVHYFIRDGNAHQYFRLDQLSGSMQTAQIFSSHAIGDYLLIIEARDCGQPMLSTTSKIVVQIDNSPSKSNMITGGIFNTNGLLGTEHRFNLYIVITIVVACGIISILLVSAICCLSRRTQRSTQLLCSAPVSNGDVFGDHSTVGRRDKIETMYPFYGTDSSGVKGDGQTQFFYEPNGLTRLGYYGNNLDNYSNNGATLIRGCTSPIVCHYQPNVCPLTLSTDPSNDFTQQPVDVYLTTEITYRPVTEKLTSLTMNPWSSVLPLNDSNTNTHSLDADSGHGDSVDIFPQSSFMYT